jgi:hypothetical protein
MFEVIIERPRWGSRWKLGHKGRRNERTERAFDRAPTKAGMREPGWRKELNENLAPLRRFLLKHVGRPWNAVRSEMSAVLSMSSAVQKHVIDHLKDFVEENPVMIDGRPHRPAAMGGEYFPLRSHGRWSGFYVCPRTGLLRQVTPCRRKPPKQASGETVVDARRGMGQ